MLCNFCLQRKEAVGDSEELPKNIVDGLEDITPEMLEVHFVQLVNSYSTCSSKNVYVSFSCKKFLIWLNAQ